MMVPVTYLITKPNASLKEPGKTGKKYDFTSLYFIQRIAGLKPSLMEMFMKEPIMKANLMD